MGLIPPSVSEKDVREKANRCAHKAGHCDRDGQPMTRLNPERQKRITDAYREGYKKVFGHD